MVEHDNRNNIIMHNERMEVVTKMQKVLARTKKHPKRFLGFNKKTLVISLMALMAVMILTLGGVVYAMWQGTVSMNVHVISPDNDEVGLFLDEALTQPVSTINWGTFKAGDNVTQNFYMALTGEADNVTYFDITLTQAGAEGSLTLVPDQPVYSLADGDVVPVSLTLAAHDDARGSFDLDLVINSELS